MPPAVPSPNPLPPRPPVKRALRLAYVMGWSYVVTVLALYFLSGVPPGSLYQLVLQTSVVFTIIGVLELVWAHKLKKTGDPKWARVLAGNEVAGTFGLLWNLAWLERIPTGELTKLIDPPTVAKYQQLYHSFGLDLTQEVINHSMVVAKGLTVYGVGALLLLSQIWVIWRYLSLAREIAAETNLPPILS